MKRILRNIDKPLLILSFILFVIGLIMIFSASNVTAYMKYDLSPYRFFLKQAGILIFSMILSLGIITFYTKSYHIIADIAVYAIGASLLLLLLYGTVRNKAISWINLGFISIQPSEFAKIIIIVFISCYYDRQKKHLDQWMRVLYPIILAAIIAGLIFAQPDLGTTIIYTLIVAAIFFMAPIAKEIRNKVLLIIFGIIALGVIVLVGAGNSLLTEEQKERFDFSKPCSTEKFYGSGNQVCNGYIAINNGKFFGVGLGKSTQKYLYLPEAHTDFIFAITMEELGYFGAIGIFVLYYLLIGRIIKIGRESHETRGFLICMGVAVYIIIHIFVNIGGIFGIIPMTGVPLPFMSYGGSFAMCLVVALTLVQRVHVETQFYKENQVKKLKKS